MACRLVQHPAVALAHFTTPQQWCAVGVAVHGTTRPGDAGGSRAAVVWLCHRNGSTASWLSLPGDAPSVTVDGPGTARRNDPANRGVVASALRRSLR